ncbi:MAG: Rdx family protein [Proteobacteria bacterium]|nr:Rdx family protein [Pseudomonadota bacterium]
MLSAAGGHQVELVEGRGGVFEIRRNGEPVYSKKVSGRYPNDAELQALAAR